MKKIYALLIIILIILGCGSKSQEEQTEIVNVQRGGLGVGLVDFYTTKNEIIPGESTEIIITLYNKGTDAAKELEVSLLNEDDYSILDNKFFSVPLIEPKESYEKVFRVKSPLKGSSTVNPLAKYCYDYFSVGSVETRVVDDEIYDPSVSTPSAQSFKTESPTQFSYSVRNPLVVISEGSYHTLQISLKNVGDGYVFEDNVIPGDIVLKTNIKNLVTNLTTNENRLSLKEFSNEFIVPEVVKPSLTETETDKENMKTIIEFRVQDSKCVYPKCKKLIRGQLTVDYPKEFGVVKTEKINSGGIIKIHNENNPKFFVNYYNPNLIIGYQRTYPCDPDIYDYSNLNQGIEVRLNQDCNVLEVRENVLNIKKIASPQFEIPLKICSKGTVDSLIRIDVSCDGNSQSLSEVTYNPIIKDLKICSKGTVDSLIKNCDSCDGNCQSLSEATNSITENTQKMESETFLEYFCSKNGETRFVKDCSSCSGGICDRKIVKKVDNVLKTGKRFLCEDLGLVESCLSCKTSFCNKIVGVENEETLLKSEVKEEFEKIKITSLSLNPHHRVFVLYINTQSEEYEEFGYNPNFLKIKEKFLKTDKKIFFNQKFSLRGETITDVLCSNSLLKNETVICVFDKNKPSDNAVLSFPLMLKGTGTASETDLPLFNPIDTRLELETYSSYKYCVQTSHVSITSTEK